ncbi:MAG: hypothetical protein ABIR15_05140 [Chitinophagaceae bacterium]
MIHYLLGEIKLSQADDYMLCSVAAGGNAGGHATLPKAIFVKNHNFQLMYNSFV